ncbi:MAG TPA: DUF4268 domain-containing protein [Chitinophagaceae bacterium]|nr:DUF4268 domain-containing protein [Chitinophagaceae bacterium]
MFSRQETAALTQQFWTRFGQYMAPVPAAGGGKVNWINYKTGVKDLQFKMELDAAGAHIGIVITATDERRRAALFQQLLACRNILEAKTQEVWDWQPDGRNAQAQIMSRIETHLAAVHVYKQADWPAIISFFKARMMALDEFWEEVQPGFEQ